MSHPTSVLTRPMDTDFRGPRLGPGGSEAAHFQDSARRMPNFSYGPMQQALHTKWTKDSTSHYNWQTNGTSTYHSSQTMSEWEPGDNGINQLLFGMTPDRSDTLESDMRLHGEHMFCLSMLNYMMRYDPDWRAKYGSIRNGDELMNSHINFKGIQKVEQRDIEMRGGKNLLSDEQGYTVFGRHSMPNVWLAAGKCGGHVGVGMSLYILARRHRFIEDPRTQRDAPSDPATRARLGLSTKHPRPATLKRVREEEEEEIENEYKRPRVDPFPANPAADNAMLDMYNDFADPLGAAVAVPLSLPADFGSRVTAVEHGRNLDDEANPAEEYYWSFDPYVSPHRTNPDPCVFNNANGEGSWIHIGQVSHLVADHLNHVTADARAQAQAAVYPTRRDKAYMTPLYGGNNVEIMMRVGQTTM